MKKKYKRIIGAVIVIIALTVWGISAGRPLAVTTEQVVWGSLERNFTVQAELEPVSSMVLNAPAAGSVAEIPFRNGAEMEAGAVLLRTDTSQEINMDLQREQIGQQLSAARQEYDRMYGENGQAQSAFAAAESQYLLAQQNYDNGKVLTASGDMAPAALEVLKAEREVAYQQYVQARENLSEVRKGTYREQIASLERQLEALTDVASPGILYMPYHGVLWETYVETGAYLSQNQPVLKVYPAGEMKAAASVLAEDAAFMETGMEAEITYPDGSKTSAEVTFISRIAAKALSSTGIEESRCRVELTADEMPEWLGAGQEVDVTLRIIKAGQVLTVPSSAIIPKGTGSMVYVVAEGKAAATAVETGETEGGRVEIVSGISQGDVIVSDPYESGVKDGMRVSAKGTDQKIK